MDWSDQIRINAAESERQCELDLIVLDGGKMVIKAKFEEVEVCKL